MDECSVLVWIEGVAGGKDKGEQEAVQTEKW